MAIIDFPPIEVARRRTLLIIGAAAIPPILDRDVSPFTTVPVNGELSSSVLG